MEMMIKYALAKGISIYGVKGPSVLNIYFNIVKHVVIDYMHCVLLGVVKQLLDIRLDPSYSSFYYYINPTKAKIKKYLLNLKPQIFLEYMPVFYLKECIGKPQNTGHGCCILLYQY